MPLQEWIHHWEEGAGVKVLKVASAIMGFVVLAALFDALAYEPFSSEEAMETAQVARNLAHGRGYTTQTVRPLSVYLLRKEAGAGGAAGVLVRAAPDTSTPPAYPVLLAGLMSVLPFDFVASQYWYFGPEQWIAVFNQVLFFVAVLLLFHIARRLFDSRVAWLSSVLFAGSHLYWRFTVSGLSTSWLIVVLLGATFCLVRLQEKEQAGCSGVGSVVLAGWVGVWIGVGGLSRYAFGWLIIPVLVFIGWIAPRGRWKLCLAAGAAFLVVLGPWVGRNIVVSGTCFGTSGYAILEQTPPFPGDTLERSFDPTAGLRRVGPLDVVDKFLFNARDIGRNDLPRLGGNWVSAFFLVGLFIPFRNPALGRMRVFLLWLIVVLFVAQAAGETHLSWDSPEINSENLLALAAPLVFIYGVAVFYTLFDQLHLVAMDARGAVMAGFVLLASAPLLMSLLAGRNPGVNTPYSPRHIQRVAWIMGAEEFMLSDIPAAVAWYGDRQCGWLPLDDDRGFYEFNSMKPVKAVFLTQRTTDSRFLSQMTQDTKSWGHFVFECQSHGEVPAGFPLTKAPLGFLPDQMLVSDRARWRMAPVTP